MENSLPDIDSPLYKNANVAIYQGDSLKILQAMPQGFADMVFADPPYNLSNGGSTCHGGKRVSVNKGDWDQSHGIEEDFKFHNSWISACKRILKPKGTIWISGTYHSIYVCGYALQSQGWHILNDIAWFKPNAAPNLACRMFTASHETLLWAKTSKNAAHYFDYQAMKNLDWQNDSLKNPGKQMRSVWELTGPAKTEKIHGKHPTQKPVALLERIILAACPQGGMVVDPFCGSASTGVAAIKHGRKFIGIDKSKEYLQNLALPRLADSMESRSLWRE